MAIPGSIMGEHQQPRGMVMSKKITEYTKEEALQELQVDVHPVRRYWLEIAAGLRERDENHGQRGKDKALVRAIPASKTLATRYYEQTGRRIDGEMIKQREMVEIMFTTASEIEDAEVRFEALNKAQAAMAKFNSTWLPYMEQKLGTLQSTGTLEDKISLEQALENYDDTSGSE